MSSGQRIMFQTGQLRWKRYVVNLREKCKNIEGKAKRISSWNKKSWIKGNCISFNLHSLLHEKTQNKWRPRQMSRYWQNLTNRISCFKTKLLFIELKLLPKLTWTLLWDISVIILNNETCRKCFKLANYLIKKAVLKSSQDKS